MFESTLHGTDKRKDDYKMDCIANIREKPLLSHSLKSYLNRIMINSPISFKT